MLEKSDFEIAEMFGIINAAYPIGILSIIISVMAIVMAVLALQKVKGNESEIRKAKRGLIFGVIGIVIVGLILIFLRTVLG